jgi:hypothetical protein
MSWCLVGSEMCIRDRYFIGFYFAAKQFDKRLAE